MRLQEALGNREDFARLKEMFSLARNRFVGIKKATIHVSSCLIAYIS